MHIGDIRERRFNLMDRGHDVGHADYRQNVPPVTQEPYTTGPRPTYWEKITGDELF